MILPPTDFLDVNCTTQTASDDCKPYPNSACLETTTTGIYGCACEEGAGFERDKNGGKLCGRCEACSISQNRILSFLPLQ